jgi:endoglucanase
VGADPAEARAQDTIQRYLRPVSTAATLNLAASAAQASRLWKTYDPAFSKRALDAAEVAWQAAKANPNIVAEGEVKGGGSYGDSTFADEIYWAAAELFITTGKPEYEKEIEASPHNTAITVNAGGGSSSMSWDQVAALGKISLAVVPNGLAKAAHRRAAARDRGRRGDLPQLRPPRRLPRAAAGPDALSVGVQLVHSQRPDHRGARLRLHPRREVRGGRRRRDGLHPRQEPQGAVVRERLRRLARSRTRTTGSGPTRKIRSCRACRRASSRVAPTRGSRIPYAKQIGLSGCAPQQCYVDDIESWSTNEIAINWNAPLAWVAAFLDDVSRRR